jgi:3-isopropylmalate/(R)-2-methylmalate dehydratase small subunit
VFGDDLNTDLLMPMVAVFAPRAEQRNYCMSANRPGWVDQVQPGDILVAGKNFGTGSGRAGTRVLKDVGISILLVESLNGLFLRNCVNYCLPALEVPGIAAAVEEGDELDVDFAAGTVHNRRNGRGLRGEPWPAMLMGIYRAGGTLRQLYDEGYIRRPD